MRWLVAVLVGVLAVTAAPAGAAAARRWPVLDGAQLRHLPRGLGGSTDFDYQYDRVKFVARVWESGSDAAGWRVDLDLEIMRGKRLRTARALHDWFIRYEDRPRAEAHYRRVRVHGHRGWRSRDEVFWLVRPGLAVAITIDRTHWSRRELMRTARGVVLRR